MIRVNIGCGQTPTEGWRNFDNSLSLHLAQVPVLPKVLGKLKLLDDSQLQFIEFARASQIEYCDATKKLPFADGAVGVLYSSHMLEHLDREEASCFLREARRVLRVGGIIRIAVPDIHKQVLRYVKTADANAFIAGTLLCQPRPRTLAQRLRILFSGTRHHQWMYDGNSLCDLLRKQGFEKVEVLPEGATRIHEPGSLNLRERAYESVYVEAEKP